MCSNSERRYVARFKVVEAKLRYSYNGSTELCQGSGVSSILTYRSNFNGRRRGWVIGDTVYIIRAVRFRLRPPIYSGCRKVIGSHPGLEPGVVLDPAGSTPAILTNLTGQKNISCPKILTAYYLVPPISVTVRLVANLTRGNKAKLAD